MNENPFPGVDPYLEPYWSGVHARMIGLLSNQIQEQLPDGLWADVEETVVVEGGAGDGRMLHPDVGVFDSGASSAADLPDCGGLAVAEPLVVREPGEVTERTVVVIDTTSGDQVVTAIELLSPANKCSREGRSRYRERCRAYRQAGANLVEIDLLRTGNYILSAPQHRIPTDAHSIISVWRLYSRRWELYPVPLSEPLPVFRVPLRPQDRDVLLRLQEAFDENYRHGRYPVRVDYSKPSAPRLSPEDAAWIDTRLVEQGLR